MVRQDYFSIDDILAEEPMVFATFLTDGYLLGHLDPLGSMADESNKENIPIRSNTLMMDGTGTALQPLARESHRNLRAGRRVALPFWLVETLATRGAVDVHLPRCYGPRARNDLRADASSVSLHKACAFYYKLGLLLARLQGDQTLVAMLLKAFSERCWPAVDAAVYGSAMRKGAEVMQKLDATERELFFASHGMAIAMSRCKERNADKIRMSHTVLGKRSPLAARLPDSSPITPRPRFR
jgi:GINS complex subunit 3